MDSKVYNQSGSEVTKISLPKTVFGLPWNSKVENLVHQVFVSMMGNKRVPTAHTKNRGEVSGTGKKPWRQKGTGRARHGSTRSPIWVGGGIAHGPRNERNYKRKINKKMKKKALLHLLSKKFKDGEVLFVDKITFDKPKTKDAKKTLLSLSKIENFSYLDKKKNNTALITLSESLDNTKKSFRNFGNIGIEDFKNINILDILKYKYLIISDPEKSLLFFGDKK